MRKFLGVSLGLFLSLVAFAADVTIKVVDPQSAAVSGAQVALLRSNGTRILATQTTSPAGQSTFQLPARRFLSDQGSRARLRCRVR